MRGLKIFIGKGQCILCHSGPYFSDQSFHNVGLVPKTVASVFNYGPDTGASDGLKKLINNPHNTKGKFSDGYDGRHPNNINDKKFIGAFKTPMLRCIGKRKSFMHTGQMHTLDEVVTFFSNGGDPYQNVGVNELKRINLNVNEKKDLVNFIKSLDGPGPPKKFLSQPK